MNDPKQLADRLYELRERLKPVFTTLLKIDDQMAVGASVVVDRVDDDLSDIIIDLLREERIDTASWLRAFADDFENAATYNSLRRAADLLDGGR